MYRKTLHVKSSLDAVDEALGRLNVLNETLACMGRSLEPDEITSLRNRMRSTQMDLLHTHNQLMTNVNALIDELKRIPVELGGVA